ncbi:MAG: lipopolysaccharide assembly protein LapA domain-containing protein [Marinobacterium sp.]|nr:lipopolysaccharide assembly protein LapA domain-containing protein [Marinobacterium sp.]
MRWLKTLITGILCIAVLLAGIQFTIHNTQKVAIDLVVVQLPEASLSLWLLAALGLGAVLGIILSIFTVLALRVRLGAARRRASTTQRELDELRTSSLKDAV